MRVAVHYAAWLVGLAQAETQTTARERGFLVMMRIPLQAQPAPAAKAA